MDHTPRHQLQHSKLKDYSVCCQFAKVFPNMSSTFLKPRISLNYNETVQMTIKYTNCECVD